MCFWKKKMSSHKEEKWKQWPPNGSSTIEKQIDEMTNSLDEINRRLDITWD